MALFSFFSTVMIVLGMIEYLLVFYCTVPSTLHNSHSTKAYVLKVSIISLAIGDAIHAASFLYYYMAHGSAVDLSLIANMCLPTGLFIGRILFLWLNRLDEMSKWKGK